VFYELRWYLFMVKEPKKYVGNNPLAQLMMFLFFTIGAVYMICTGFALYAEQEGVQTGWYTAFGWVFGVLGESMTVRLWHHISMWIILIFSMVHMYMAIREDMTHRQTTISSMVSGWRFYR
jgi:Ni/Fe-hydrogenase 1 B-type cytochrome subunit